MVKTQNSKHTKKGEKKKGTKTFPEALVFITSKEVEGCELSNTETK